MRHFENRRYLIPILLLLLLVLAPRASWAEEAAGSEPPATDGEQTGKNAPDSAATKDDKPWPSKIGPFFIKSEDGQHKLQFGLALQLQVLVNSKDMGGGERRELDYYGEVRRIRPSLSASIFDDLFRFYLHMSTAPGSLEIIDAFVEYAPQPYANLRLGQFKLPFTRYRIQSYKNLTLVDWALASKYMGAEREFGMALHSGLEKPQEIDYAVGVFTGTNARASHAIGVATLYGEAVENPSDLANPERKMDLHPEFVARIGYNYNGINPRSDTDFEGGPFRMAGGLNATYDVKPDMAEDFTARFAPEFLMKAYGYSLYLVGYLGFAEKTQQDELPRLAMTGLLAQTSYLFVKRVELAMRYTLLHNRDEFRDDARERAAKIIGAEADEEAQAALEKTYKKAGKVKFEHEASFGVNVYIIGQSLKWQNDISLLRHDLLDESRNDVRFRSMVQLAF